MNSRNRDTRCFLFGMLVTIILAGIISSCSDSKIERQLSQGESLIIGHPDSTVAMLAHMDTTCMSESQRARQELLYVYTQLVYGCQIPLDSAVIAEGDRAFTGGLDENEVKWLIVKSAEAKRTGNPVARLELLKDAEFLAIQLNDSIDLGMTYLFLSNVYEQGFNGTVSKHYADMAFEIFRGLNWRNKMRDARMAVVGAYCVQRDYRSMLDSLIAMRPEVMANAPESYRIFFLDQMARSYDSAGQSEKAIEIWHSIYDGKDVSANTLAHWSHAYCHINELDSAYAFIQLAKGLPHNATDDALCLNVEYDILEKMGRASELKRVDSLRNRAATSVVRERRLEESSLALNLKYDSAARKAWLDAAEARNRTTIAIFITLLAIIIGISLYVFLKKRNRMLRLEHENDILKIKTMQDNLFKSDCLNKDISARIAELFQTRFNLIDSLAATYFECKDTGQEQKRIYSDVKTALSNFGTKEAIGELTGIVNGYKNNLMTHFKDDFPKMSASQYRLALYLFCGFSLPAISIFTDTEIRNIYVYKSRLKSAISKSDAPRKAEYLQYLG